MTRRILAQLAATLGAIPAALWIVRQERLIQHRGRRLNSEERGFALQIGIHDVDAIRVLSVPKIPSPFAGRLERLEDRIGFSLSTAAGVTLGYGIYVAERSECHALLCHELVHVRQYEALGGPLPFIRRYFFECLAYGYCNAPLEREAVELSGT